MYYKLFEKLKEFLKSKLNSFVLVYIYKNLNKLEMKKITHLLNSTWFKKVIIPKKILIKKKKKILVISPHPDDEVIGCGGTLLKYDCLNSEIIIVYITNGTNNQSKQKNRKSEAKRLCKKMNWEHIFLDFELKSKTWNYLKLKQAIDKVNPEIIFIPSLFDDNIEHKNANFLLNDSIKNSSKFSIWSYQVYSSHITNTVIDITDQIKKKAELINIYKSQSKIRDWVHFSQGLNAWNSRLIGTRGKKIWVETFMVFDSKSYKSYIHKFTNI